MRSMAVLLGALLVLSGCTSAPKAEGPKLISFADRQRSRIEPAVNTGAYGSIADKISALAQDVYTGTDLAFSETILNEGLPSKGIRFTVKGSALANGMFGLPKKASVRGQFTEKGKSDDEKPIDFYADTTGGWQASVPDVTYGSQIEVSFVAPAVRGGNGDIQLFVYPMDKKGSSSAIVTHNYRVLDPGDSAPSDGSTSNDIQVPTDN